MPATMERIEVRRSSGALGAEIFGVDLAARLDEATVAALRAALLEHIVIFFRDQRLSPQDLLAVARRFGEVVEYPFVRGLPECPLVLPVIKEPHERANFGGVWHSDTAYLEQPAMATMLYALETPPVGGDTMFANMTMAYETLSDGMQRLLGGLRALNVPEQAGRPADPRGDAQPSGPAPRSARPARCIRWSAPTPRPAARRSTSTSPTPRASRT